ncbi:MAG: peptidase M50 [Thermoplasmata archaeon]|nr:MAG: peptidase M50 [Thermoplasmata archaeon]
MMEKLIAELVIIFGIWVFLMYLTKVKGGEHFTLVGPLIMWKTGKGKKFIDRIAKRKFWKGYGNAAIIITVIAMILTSLLVIWNVIISLKMPPQNAPSPRLIIGLPGINPVIPIGYGIIALAIAIIFHEFSHGILARAGKIKVNSLGLLFLILPIGAFVEPDEEQLMKVKRMKRARVFAAGPSTNIIIAIISILLLAFIFSPSIEPKENGIIAANNFENVERWSIISSLNGKVIDNITSFEKASNNMEAGKFYNITYFKNGKIHSEKYLHGIIVIDTISKSPARNVIDKGSVIYKINGIEMNNITVFENFMNTTHADQKINISCYNGNFYNRSIVLANKYKFTYDEKDRGKGFIGIMVADISNIVVPSSYYPNLYNPFKTNFLFFIALPFRGLSPFPKEIMPLYNVPMATIFWPLLNFFYWIFWLNFALGTFNALPAIPLDGGYIFKDGVGYIIERMKFKKADKITSYVASAISTIVLLAIFSILLIPHLRMLI